MTDNKQYPAVTECVRAAGGRVHSDGNIFFKNADAFIAASNAMRAAQPHDHGPMAATIEEAARDVGKWLNERPNRPLDLRHVAMLVHHAQAAQPERVPLSDRQISDAYFEALGSQHLREQDRKMVTRFARAIETAHGIQPHKEQPNG